MGFARWHMGSLLAAIDGIDETAWTPIAYPENGLAPEWISARGTTSQQLSISSPARWGTR
jgi:hypothetical protein